MYFNFTNLFTKSKHLVKGLLTVRTFCENNNNNNNKDKVMKVLNVAEKNDAAKRIAALLSNGQSQMVRKGQYH